MSPDATRWHCHYCECTFWTPARFWRQAIIFHFDMRHRAPSCS